MGSITRPAAQAPVETPFDHLTGLLALIADPKAHAKRIAELKAGIDAQHQVAQQAAELRKNAVEAKESADLSSAFANERHDDADKREAALRVREDQIKAREDALTASEATLADSRAAWARHMVETESAHKLLNDAIAKQHAEATEAKEAAQDDRADAAELKATHVKLHEEAATWWARSKAILAAAEG